MDYWRYCVPTVLHGRNKSEKGIPSVLRACTLVVRSTESMGVSLLLIAGDKTVGYSTIWEEENSDRP